MLIAHGVGASAEGARAAADCVALVGAEVVGRHISLGATDDESLLHDALVVCQMQGKRELALQMLRRASVLERREPAPPHAVQKQLLSRQGRFL